MKTIPRHQALIDLRRRWHDKEARLPWGTRRVGRRLAYHGVRAALYQQQYANADGVASTAEDAVRNAAGFSPVAWFIASMVVQLLLPILREWLFEKTQEARGEGFVVSGPISDEEAKVWSG